MSETWAWISGWAISPQRFQRAAKEFFPDWEHLVFAPGSDSIERILVSGATRIGGYSLGSLLVLSNLERFPKSRDIFCLAPILGFCADAGLGGTTTVNNLAMIRKRLEANPVQALKLFYRLAGLKEEVGRDLPYGLEGLLWGLDALRDISVDSTRLENVNAVMGELDPLLDYSFLMQQFPSALCSRSSGHNYSELLRCLSEAEARHG